MRFSMREDRNRPVILGGTAQTGLRMVSIAVIAAVALVALQTPRHVPRHSQEAVAPDFKIDINRAGLREWTLLPGIGTVTAQRILADRRDRGPFTSMDDLQRVPGIGPKTVRSIEPYCQRVVVRSAMTEGGGESNQ